MVNIISLLKQNCLHKSEPYFQCVPQFVKKKNYVLEKKTEVAKSVQSFEGSEDETGAGGKGNIH